MKTKNILKLIDKANEKYIDYSGVCGELAKQAQKHVDMAEVTCEYYPSDGICLCIELDDNFPYVIPASLFFNFAKGGKKVNKEDIKLMAI